MKKLIKMTLAALALASGTAYAEAVSESLARTVAENFLANDSIGRSVLSGRTVDAVTKRTGLWLVTLKPNGHLLVSANRSAEPIPSFSEHDFDEPTAGSPQAALLALVATNALNATGAVYETRWLALLGVQAPRRATAGVRTAAAAEYVNIEPLVQSSWTQNYPFNELIPVINSSHAPVGCVATAYSQILRYWQWPEILDEDIITEHSVDSMWGHKWRLKAGTVLDWQDMPHAGGYDNATRLKLGRAAMLAGMLAHMSYKAKASGAQSGQPGKNLWFTPHRALGTSNSTLEEREEAMKASLKNGCPIMVSVDTTEGGHSVVGDGWQESSSGKYVHLNYGWGYNNSYYGTSTALDVFLDAKPRPMVMNRPLPTSARLPLTVAWSFPPKGYADTLTGFDVTYVEVSDTVADWSDDMSVGTGTADGDCIGVETVDASGHGNVLRIGTKAEEATYTWPTMVATKETVLSFDLRSCNALGMTVEVQLLDPSVGWITLATPEVGENSTIDWATHRFGLGDYAGKGVAVRVKATRSGSSSYNDDTFRATGVQFDNVRLTQVRQATANVVGRQTAAKADRSCAIGDAALLAGKTYLFQVTPTFSDGTKGMPGFAASCTIAAADSDKPTITSVESVSLSAPQMQDGMFRECYFGRNQFGVYGSSALTKLEAHLSNLAVIGEVQKQDETQPEGTMVTVHDKVSVENAVTVAKKGDGQFLVTVDVSNLTTYLSYTGMILTLVGRNASGDAVQKDVCLRFTKSGGETAIAAADLPAAGTITGGGGDTPVTMTRTVSFSTLGGTAVSAITVTSGKAIGDLPATTREGYAFLGWFTEYTDGDQVTPQTVITKDVILFAHWQENAPAVVTYTVTFDPNGGSPEQTRDVSENGQVGTLPTTLTKSGCTLVGWFTARDGGKQVFATQVITASVTYYAHWEATTGGGTGGDPNDDGVTRFCSGVTKTTGAYDVTRTGTWNALTPVGYNLVFWWVDRYFALHGENPSDYKAPATTSIPNDGSYTIQSYTALLLDSALPTTLSVGANREPYFPSVSYTADDWNGTATGGERLKAAGRRIYAALANGPIGIKVTYSLSRSYGAVIWGCDYATDGSDRYATAVYLTDTTSSTRNDKVVSRALGICETYDGNFSGVGLKAFNSNDGVIASYYPITEPVGGAQPEDPEDPEDPVDPEEPEDPEDPEDPEEPEEPEVPVDPEEPEEPEEPEDPEEPVVPSDEPIGAASNDNDPGTDYTASYKYEMYDSYWTARKRAIQQGKQLFVLSGASWCSNCAFVKSYLTTLGTAFTDAFVVYYSNHDDDVTSPYFHGGLPQYGAADPREVDAFTGTLDGATRTWSSAWTTAGSGIYRQDRGGFASDRVDTVVAAGRAKAKYAAPTELVIRGLSTLAAGHPGQYELFAKFADGVEMPVDRGVTWSVVSGSGTVADAGVDGREVTALTIASGDVVLRATSAFYFTGSKTVTVRSTDLANVASVAIATESVNLEDDATPLIDATATMTDGSTVAVVGFGDWSASFKGRIDRKDADLEEDNVTPTISFDGNSRLTYAKTNGRLAVCDQRIEVALVVNGKRTTKEITVWGPTKVAPSKWRMVSAPRQTALGVVRLQCTELKYNYGGEIKRTSDTYFASYKTVLRQGTATVETSLRGLTAYAFSEQDGTCTVGLAATKVNGKYAGYAPTDPTASELATNFTCVAKGSAVTDIAKGAVPSGFFRAFFPDAAAADYPALAERDSDGDGFLNWEEYVLGTDPTDAGDAFTLLQGYQHLAAPAADGETLQYKVMYAQRARRIYTIEAKKDWSDAWAPVATVSLANAAESDVTSFTGLDADTANAAMFFRVRASLYEHVFNDPDTAPSITPNMLVAAPGAVIDLSASSATLDLSSFDTDATDPGTVYVKAPSNAKAGDVLVTAPAAAAKSMAALKALNLPEGLHGVVRPAKDGRLAFAVASVTPDPSVEGGDGKGTVEVTDERIVVTPAADVREIVLNNPGDRQVEIPPCIEAIGGVTDSARIVVRSNGHDITKAMKFTADGGRFKIELDAQAKVTIGGEEISVTPELANAADEKPFEEKDGAFVFRVKSIPGLKYQVLSSETLDPDGFAPSGTAQEATGTRRELTVPRKAATQGFYRIQVGR